MLNEKVTNLGFKSHELDNGVPRMTSGGNRGYFNRLAILAYAAAALLAVTRADAATPFVSVAQRIAAATTTARSASNACTAIRPFYWEVGNSNSALAAGSVDPPGSLTPAYTATTSINIASASKWLYAAYVVQKQAGLLSASDIKFLTFRSGYVSFSGCGPLQTVDGCLYTGTNWVYAPPKDGLFHYGGGHMQKHASLKGLGAFGNAALAAELRTQLGNDVGLTYSQPQPAGGVVSTARDYARFLRKLLRGELRMGNLLGAHAVCANRFTCNRVSYTPIPATEQWRYSLGHWVETDPVVGDGAFSSAGTFGFYPWVDASRRWYGVVARHDLPGSAHESVQCGRLIRKAWVTGTAQ